MSRKRKQTRNDKARSAKAVLQAIAEMNQEQSVDFHGLLSKNIGAAHQRRRRKVRRAVEDRRLRLDPDFEKGHAPLTG